MRYPDMEPLQAKELVLDSSLLYECNYYYPGIAREDVDQYLDAGGEFHYEESFGIREDGLPYGNFSVTLPKFNGKLDQEQWISWRREHGYSHLYVGESYISMYYYREGYEGGMREWNNAFDNNVLVKKMGDLRSYLTPDGMVLCYERCEVQAGCSGRPTFEIPYEWFADIFKQ